MITLALGLLASLFVAAAIDVGQWTIHGDPGHDEVARTVAELLPRAQGELERKLGLAIRGRAVVVLCGSTAGFRRSTPGMDHRHTLGVAYPGRKVIYLNCAAIEVRPLESLAVTLRHEVSHLIVGGVLRRGHRRVPLWFDEGVAAWSSGKVPLYDPREFRRAVAAGALRPLAELADVFPAEPAARGVAYEQSESFIRFIVGRHGEAVIREILRAAARGVGFATAFKRAVGAEVAMAERQWLAAIRPRWPWLSWALNTFTLFSAMSLFALFAFWVYWRRRRRKYQEWEMEERFYSDGGEPWL